MPVYWYIEEILNNQKNLKLIDSKNNNNQLNLGNTGGSVEQKHK